MVRGGGSARLSVYKHPFNHVQKSIRVPWNTFVYVGDVLLTVHKEVS